MFHVFDPKKLIMPPYSKCPKCAAEEFGTLGVHGKQISKRCRICTHSESFALPSLNKKVIYLDQMVLSNFLNLLNPRVDKANKVDGFYKQLWEKVERLNKLQLVAFPISDIHYTESTVSKFHQALAHMRGHLSCGLRFKQSSEIRHDQFAQALRAWLKGELPPQPQVQDGLDDELNRWNNRLNVFSVYRVPIPDLQEELESTRNHAAALLTKLFDVWRSQSGMGLDYWYQKELDSFGQGIVAQVQQISERVEGYRRMCASMGLPDPPPGLADSLMPRWFDVAVYEMEQAGIAKNEHLACFENFLNSDAIKRMPFLSVGAFMYANLASNAPNTLEPPNQGMFNDIQVVSNYWPYCDAMFIDNKGVSLLQGYGNRNSDFAVRLFSSSKRTQFLDYLTEIEASAPADHFEKVVEVYGSDFFEPYTAIFSETDW